MRAELQVSNGRAIKPSIQNDTDLSFSAQSDTEGNEWFAEPAQSLLGKDPGLALHYITGFPESSCDKYASGTRRASGFFIVTLLRTDQGEPFFNAFMGGSKARWYAELQELRWKAERYDEITRITGRA